MTAELNLNTDLKILSRLKLAAAGSTAGMVELSRIVKFLKQDDASDEVVKQTTCMINMLLIS